MSIISWPENIPRPTALCVVCNQERPLDEMGAGMCDAEERQAFACDGHFLNRNEYILGWIDFAAAQQDMRTLQQLAYEYADDTDE